MAFAVLFNALVAILDLDWSQEDLVKLPQKVVILRGSQKIPLFNMWLKLLVVQLVNDDLKLVIAWNR